jgi:ligand-binding sensor domain-containing protein/DNA-binding CsgD family transcriptional regulator
MYMTKSFNRHFRTPLAPVSRCITLVSCILLAWHAEGQNTIGIPRIVNVSKETYHAGTQVWDMGQDTSGRMYFANAEGLLTYDGGYWKLHPLPNRTNMRSLAIGSDGKVFVGGQGELGYFRADALGRLRFTSLIPFLPASQRNFADIWDIEVMGESVFFRVSDRAILEYRDGGFTSYPAADAWLHLQQAGGRLFAQDRSRGIHVLSRQRWVPLTDADLVRDRPVAGILEDVGGTQLLLTTDGKAHRIAHDSLKPAPSWKGPEVGSRIFRAFAVGQDAIAFATVSRGCIITDRNGRVIQRISRTEGLQDNNVISIFSDREGNLWTGLNNGISCIAFDAAIKYITPDPENELSGYSARIIDGHLYLGTSDGVFHARLEPGRRDLSFSRSAFRKVLHTEGQTWRIDEVNGSLLIAHTNGIFHLTPGQEVATRISPDPGWIFIPTSPVSPSPDILAGTYTGLKRLGYRDGAITDKGNLKGTYESLRFLTQDNDGLIWASHPYRGIYRIRPDLNRGIYAADLMAEREGLPSALGNHVYKVRNKPAFGTQQGVFTYDAGSGRFQRSAFFDSLLGHREVRYLQEDDKGRIWFCTGKQIGIIHPDRATGRMQVRMFPELSGRILSGFENVYPYDEHNVFIASEKGMVHVDLQKYLQGGRRPRPILSQVRAVGLNDSILYDGHTPSPGGEATAAEQPSLPARFDAYHFEYASPTYAAPETVEYSYLLEGYDPKWSEWSGRTEKDYTNLAAGDYVFRVRTRDDTGHTSEAEGYPFTIRPPWYAGFWARMLYLMAGLLAGYGLHRYQRMRLDGQRKRYEEEQQRMLVLHQLEIEKNEKEIIRLQNERLEQEILLKNRELADTSMHLVERNEALAKVKDSLQRIYRDKQGDHDIRRTLQLIGEIEKNDESWDRFATHFDEINDNFMRNLRQAFPKLTVTDLKLCAYLELNLSSKEIAQLANISVRGVEIARYRLRRKLGLGTEESLPEFLDKFKKSS